MRIIAIGIIVGLILIGVGYTSYGIHILTKRLQYTKKYRDEFLQFCKQIKDGKIEDQTYYNLVHDVKRIQFELGIDGIISVYCDPETGFQTNNYAIFLNFFNELRINLTCYCVLEDRINLSIGTCDEALIKHIGQLETTIEYRKNKIKNPFYCFSKGISCIISLPIKFLEWCEIINKKSSDKILSSKIYKAINNIIVIINLLSAIITITTGWDGFTGIVQACLNLFR